MKGWKLSFHKLMKQNIDIDMAAYHVGGAERQGSSLASYAI
jgi:hypothetical protein